MPSPQTSSPKAPPAAAPRHPNPRPPAAGQDGRGPARPGAPRSRDASHAPAAAAAPKPVATSHPTELGWYPDYVYTGEKFEAGMAFFADALGRITRFSRDPADLAIARRLAGQAVLPGLVNGHTTAWHRLLRGRTETAARGNGDARAGWREGHDRVAGQLAAEDLFEVARMAFTEMLLSGITCVGEFQTLRPPAGGAAANEMTLAVAQAAHEVGLRIAIFHVAAFRPAHGQPPVANTRFHAESVDAFLREAERFRLEIERRHASDEVWLGLAPESPGSVPLEAFKAIANYAHSHRMRLQTRLALTREDVEACVAEYKRSPVALLAEHGVVDKRFTAVHALHVTEEECRLLGTARASVCVCPSTETDWALPPAPFEAITASGAGFSLGSGMQAQTDLLKEGRLLEYDLRRRTGRRPAFTANPAAAILHASTVGGARSLGATGGALEVGRPADFFTVNIYDPSIAGAEREALLPNIVFALERRAIREVWVGARQKIANGRHLNQGLNVGKFVELQRRLWP